jgi:hypothetical protein
MPTKEWVRNRDDETGPGPASKREQPEQQGNPARGKENEHKTLQPHRGRQSAETWKGNRTDVGDARKNAR